MNELSNIRMALEQLKPELMHKYHVRTLGLFGSVVRDDYNDKSDIDIIVDFKQPIGIEFVDLADYIEHKIKKKVDLVSRNGIKEKYFKEIEPEIIII